MFTNHLGNIFFSMLKIISRIKIFREIGPLNLWSEWGGLYRQVRCTILVCILPYIVCVRWCGDYFQHVLSHWCHPTCSTGSCLSEMLTETTKFDYLVDSSLHQRQSKNRYSLHLATLAEASLSPWAGSRFLSVVSTHLQWRNKSLRKH